MSATCLEPPQSRKQNRKRYHRVMRFLLLALNAAAAIAQTRDQRIAQFADSIRQQTIDCRRDLHMHPELSNREERTAKIVAARKFVGSGRAPL